MNVKIEELSDGHRRWVRKLLAERWGSQMVASRGRLHDAVKLPGFVATVGTELRGVVTYRIEGGECEVMTLDSLLEGRGIGRALMEAVIDQAAAEGCGRVWLITTNDNTVALRFFQKRGFALVAVHRGAIEESRRLKPEIPEIGMDSIPIRDEIELEIRFE
ncbi:MAG: GNAT family N-acetyltransferase [Candidatus Latescibacterota bacterium]|nr:MAG: GNAT family N-acetyltransferase [Candidatus Latescibacterota bacterium]